MVFDWNGTTAQLSKMTDIASADITRGIVQADDDSLIDPEQIVAEVPELFEKIISFLIENLKGVESIRDQWIDSNGFRASVAMLGAAVNHLLAARQLLIRGYLTESEFMLREVNDRATRAYLFRSDETAANRFLSGKQVRPAYVIKRLTKLFIKNDAESDLPFLEELHRKYKEQSERGHANLESFWFRTPGDHNGRSVDESVAPVLSGIVGSDVFIGGFRGPLMQALLMARTLDPAIYAAWVFLAMSTDTDGAWRRGYEELAREVQRIHDEIRSLSVT
jgi:hypothetical protein